MQCLVLDIKTYDYQHIICTITIGTASYDEQITVRAHTQEVRSEQTRYQTCYGTDRKR